MQTFFVHPVGVVSGGGEGPAQLRIDPALSLIHNSEPTRLDVI